jgi:hypothetical protein
VRLLATGTLAGGPLNALGSETLGGLSLLHGMVLSVFPIAYINGVDAVLGLFLVMALGAEAGWRRLAPVLIALANPQYVNVSGLYCGAALAGLAILLVAESGERDPPAAALGLVYAALVLWQRKGYAVRTAADFRRKAEGPGARERLMGRKALAFRHRLQDLAANSTIVHLDDSFAILRLRRDPAGGP